MIDQRTGKERRVSARTSMLDVMAKISKDGWNNWEEVETKDISDSGIGFVAETKYKIGQKVYLRGMVADATRSMDISCDITVAYVAETADKKYLYGASFSNLSKSQFTSLSFLVELMVIKFPTIQI
jgi:hypothetical protein